MSALIIATIPPLEVIGRREDGIAIGIEVKIRFFIFNWIHTIQ